MEKKTGKYLDWVLNLLIGVAGVFVIFINPLLLSKGGLFAEEFVKIWVIFFITGLLGSFVGIKLLFCSRLALPPLKFVLLGLAWILIYILAGTFGVNPWYSFWGRYGLWIDSTISLLIFLSWFYWGWWMSVTNKLDYLYLAVLGSGGVLGLWIMLVLNQRGEWGLTEVSRLAMTFKNPNQFGFYLVLVILLSLSFVFFRKEKIWRLMGGVVFILDLTALIYTQSRGSMIALVASVVVGAFWWWRKTLKSKFVVVIFLFTLGFVGMIYGRGVFNRFKIDLNSSRVSHEIRLQEWVTSLKVWQKHPILGIGPENMKQVYPQFKPKENNQVPEEWNWKVVAVRNKWLGMLVDVGPFGLMIFLIWGYFLMKGVEKREVLPPLILVLGYYIHSFLYNPNVSVELLFFVFSGIIVGKKMDTIKISLGKLGRWIGVFFVVVVIVWLGILIKVWESEYRAWVLQKNIRSLYKKDVVKISEEIFLTNPWFDANLRRLLTNQVLLIRSMEEGGERNEAIKKFKNNLDVLKERNLDDVENLNSYASNLMFFAGFVGDSRQESINLGKKLIELDPNSPGSWDTLGIIYLDDLQREKALDIFLFIINDLQPEYPYAYFHAGETYRQMGKPEKAIPYYQKTLEMGYGGANEMSEAYEEMNK